MSVNVETRGKILRGAIVFFADQGCGAFNMDCLSARVGVSKPTIYNHFDDKKKMIEEVAGYCVEVCTAVKELSELFDVLLGDVGKVFAALVFGQPRNDAIQAALGRLRRHLASVLVGMHGGEAVPTEAFGKVVKDHLNALLAGHVLGETVGDDGAVQVRGLAELAHARRFRAA